MKSLEQLIIISLIFILILTRLPKLAVDAEYICLECTGRINPNVFEIVPGTLSSGSPAFIVKEGIMYFEVACEASKLPYLWTTRISKVKTPPGIETTCKEILRT